MFIPKLIDQAQDSHFQLSKQLLIDSEYLHPFNLLFLFNEFGLHQIAELYLDKLSQMIDTFFLQLLCFQEAFGKSVLLNGINAEGITIKVWIVLKSDVN